MKFLRKSLSVCLAVTMLFSVFVTGCSGANVVKKEAITIDANSPWYTVQKNDVGSHYDRDDFIFFGQTELGTYKDMYVFKTEGKSADYMNMPFGGRIFNLDFHNKNGEIIKSLDLMQMAISIPEMSDAMDFLLSSLNVNGDEIDLVINKIYVDDKKSIQEETYSARLDFDSGRLTDVKIYSPDSYVNLFFNDGTVYVGAGYRITKYWNFKGIDGYSNVLELAGPSGVIANINLDNIYPDEVISGIDCIVSSDDETALVEVTSVGTFKRMWFSIDLPTGNYQKITEDMGWLSALNPDGMVYLEGQGCYTLDTDGIKRVNFEDSCADLVVDFNYCNINRFEVPSLKICSLSEDEVVLTGSIYLNPTGVMEETHSYVYLIDKCDTNPNAGKEVITIASTSELNDAVAETIFDFNQENEDYFIVFDGSYLVSRYLYENSNKFTGDAVEDMYKAQSELNTILSLDLMTGSGPDIVLNAFDCNMINKSECLMDLTSYVNKETNLLSNVVKAAKEDNKIYQLPVSFGVSGIVTSSNNVKKKGFTFDEYQKFVSDVCNGKDPLKMDRLDFFDEVLASMNDQIIKHGGDNTIDTKAIKIAAEYAKENVPVYYYEDYSREGKVVYATVNGFGDFLVGEFTNGGVDLNNLTIVGLPSIDGRGPTIVVNNSLAIAADVNNPDACWSFCQKLLSEDVQKLFFATGTPINETVLRNMCGESIDAYNKLREAYIIDGTDEVLLYQLGMTLPANQNYVDKYVEMIKTCSVISNSYDATVKMIIRQEIQGYFEGDKTIDEVTDIMQNEIKTYLDERS